MSYLVFNGVPTSKNKYVYQSIMSQLSGITTSDVDLFAVKGYKFVKKIGHGSYGWVYLAEYTNQKKSQKRACKVIDTTKAKKDFVQKFLPRELDILIKISHPHIIYICGIFQKKNKYYIFMRFAENGDLLDFILKKGAISEAQSRVWSRQIAGAVQYLHHMEVAHRDLKCENILISTSFNVKIADFGFARFVVDITGARVTSDTHCGSLTYAAPEVLKGSVYHPKIADMWSIGVVIFVMLNKALPFLEDQNVKKLYELQMNKKWRFRSKIYDLISEKVKKSLVHLLEPDVNKRWRIDQLLCSEWIAMDKRLLHLTDAEQKSLILAEDIKKNNVDCTPTLPVGKQQGEFSIIKEINENEKAFASAPMLQPDDLKDLIQK